MVTTAQVNRLDAKIDALTAAIDTDSQPITVWIFDGETPDQAAARHRELRPDHAGRVIRFEYRYLPRHPVEEMFAVQTPEEIRAAVERIWAKDDRLGDHVKRMRGVDFVAA